LYQFAIPTHGLLVADQYHCSFTTRKIMRLPIMALFKIQQAIDLFGQGNEQAGISTLQTLLLQPKLPPFWRIHALALLAHAVDDWLEAKVRVSF
jgi:hypothetical protein